MERASTFERCELINYTFSWIYLYILTTDFDDDIDDEITKSKKQKKNNNK